MGDLLAWVSELAISIPLEINKEATMPLTKTHAPRKCDYRRAQMSGSQCLVVGQLPARAYSAYSIESDITLAFASHMPHLFLFY